MQDTILHSLLDNKSALAYKLSSSDGGGGGYEFLRFLLNYTDFLFHLVYLFYALDLAVEVSEFHSSILAADLSELN